MPKYDGEQDFDATQYVSASVTASGGKFLLVGDSASPGSSKYYGTDAASNNGYHTFSYPTSPFSTSIIDTVGVPNGSSLCPIVRTVATGNNVLLNFAGWVTAVYANSDSYVSISIRNNTTGLGYTLMSVGTNNGKTIKTPIALCGFVSGLSGSNTFDVIASTQDVDFVTVYGRLVFLEVGGN